MPNDHKILPDILYILAPPPGGVFLFSLDPTFVGVIGVGGIDKIATPKIKM